MLVRRLCFAALVVTTGCLVNIDYGDSQFTCETGANECPDGQVCDEGMCRDPADLVCSDDWFDCSFSRRIPIAFDNSAGATSLVGFPALVRLNSQVIDYTRTNDDGSDIRVVAFDGTELPFEIERWDESSESIIWVQLPELVAGGLSEAYIYYGNVEATDAQNPAGVWDANYVAVWHLSNAANETHIDSTINANHGEASIALDDDAGTRGYIAGGIEFDGLDDWIQIPHSESLNITGDQVTLEAWASMTDLQAHDSGLIIKTDSAAGGYHLQLGIQQSSAPNFRVLTPTGQTYLSGGSTVPVSEWHHIAGVYDGTTAVVLYDNVADGTLAQTGDLITNTEPVLIGRRAIGDDRFFTGVIDEARISNVARSAEWLSASYRTMSGGMVTIRAEQRRY